MKNKISIAIIIATIITSCDVSYLDKEINDISWDGNVKIPAGYINYNLSEIFNELGSNDLDATSTEEFSFTHDQSFSGKDNDVYDVKIDDITINSSIKTPINASDLIAIGETFPYTITDEISPGVPNPLIGLKNVSNQKTQNLNLSQEITGGEFDGGTMIFTLTSRVDTELNISLEIPSFKEKGNGNVYKKDIRMDGESNQIITINLDEYSADFTNDGTGTGKTNNTIAISLNTTFNFEAGDTLEEDDSISYSALLTNTSTEVIYGDFKQESFNVSSNAIDLDDLFDNFQDGDVTFKNVEMSINITNDYGFPIGIDLSSIKGINNNSTINLSYTGDQSMQNILLIDEVVNFGDDARVTNRVLDNSNSNIAALLEAKPSSIDFKISGLANPVNKNPNKNFYATENTGFKIETAISFENISIKKTIDFENGSDLEDFNFVKLIANIENKIPLGGDVVLEFKNNANQIVHTEIIQVFDAANVDSSGESDGVAVLSNFEIELTESQIKNITTVTTIDVILTLKLPSQEKSVMIKGSDEINIKLGLEAGAKITLDNN